MKKLIIFDCDGTIMDSLGFAMDSFLYALEKIGRAPKGPEEIKQYFGSSADKIFLYYLKDQQLADRAFKLFLEHQEELSQETFLHSGMGEVIRVLKEKNYLLAIVTGRHTLDLEILLRPHGLLSLFDVAVADSDVATSKPSPEGIQLVLKKLGVDAQDACYIGDSAVDIRASHAASVTAVAALWDTHAKREELEAEAPHFMVERPIELLPLFFS